MLFSAGGAEAAFAAFCLKIIFKLFVAYFLEFGFERKGAFYLCNFISPMYRIRFFTRIEQDNHRFSSVIRIYNAANWDNTKLSGQTASAVYSQPKGVFRRKFYTGGAHKTFLRQNCMWFFYGCTNVKTSCIFRCVAQIVRTFNIVW